MPIIAQQMSKNIRILCLDELHVLDITDAMVLAGLLEAMFEQGITLVTTSNIAPDDLYFNGLQRNRFLPAIALIKTKTRIIKLQGDNDYRQSHTVQHQAFLPMDMSSLAIIKDYIKKIEPQHTKNTQLLIHNRTIKVLAVGEKVIWFDFNTLCNTPRSTADYLYISEHYSHIFISEIPKMNDEHNDIVQRFIRLIDSLYDHKIILIATVATLDFNQLYQGKMLISEFQRTLSRLTEMQSEAWFDNHHPSKTSHRL